jgi:hypothetical protein
VWHASSDAELAVAQDRCRRGAGAGRARSKVQPGRESCGSGGGIPSTSWFLMREGRREGLRRGRAALRPDGSGRALAEQVRHQRAQLRRLQRLL